MRVQGTYYFADSSKACPAEIEILGKHLKVLTSDGDLVLETERGFVKIGLSIPGLPDSLKFSDGSSFVPLDKSVRWPSDSLLSRIAERLMNNLTALIIILVSTPLLIWFLMFTVIPNIAESSAELIPQAPKNLLSKSLMEHLEENFFLSSEIDSMKIETIETLFYETLDDLDLDRKNYLLLFYKSDYLGANALALPDGTIILTDGMIEKLISYPDSLLSVLLHEVGHIENNHSIRLIIQSLGVGIIFTYLVGDIQGLTEIVSGSGIGLLQSSFSREMEIEADKFSVVSLDKINIPKERFIFAMETIDLDGDEPGSNSLLVKYLSTHPHTEERIQLVKDL